jgi:hypothetical protein
VKNAGAGKVFTAAIACRWDAKELKMKWHIISGSVKIQVEAENPDKAIVVALKSHSLDGFNQFFCCFVDGKGIYDSDTSWGLTEMYLEDAGYEKCGVSQWRKKQNINSPSFGNDGLTAPKAEVAPTLQPSKKSSISKTDSSEPSMPGSAQAKPEKKKSPPQTLEKKSSSENKIRGLGILSPVTDEEESEIIMFKERHRGVVKVKGYSVEEFQKRIQEAKNK